MQHQEQRVPQLEKFQHRLPRDDHRGCCRGLCRQTETHPEKLVQLHPLNQHA